MGSSRILKMLRRNPLRFWQGVLLAVILMAESLFGDSIASLAATTCPTSGNNVTITAGCNFDAGTYTFTGTLTINPGVTVTATGNTGTGAGVILISDNIRIDGTLSANALGYARGTGPGFGGVNSNGGTGGGYGGNGGQSSNGL